MKILLTGFEPYGGMENNLSWDIVSAVDTKKFVSEIIPVRLPVSFSRSPEVVRSALADIRPDYALLLGFSGNRACANIERLAVNMMDSVKPDNDGVSPVDTPVAGGAPAAYFTTLPNKDIIRAVTESGEMMKISNSAGTYVCNATLFSALDHIARNGLETRAGFIHFPLMPVETGVRVIELTIRYLEKNIL